MVALGLLSARTIARTGIDKLTCRRVLALPDRGLNVLYVDARAHSACVLTSKDAGHSHIPNTELVNLSIPVIVALRWQHSFEN